MTVAVPSAVASACTRRRSRPRLYVYSALLLASIAFAGFTPTFFSPLVAGTLALHPAILVHGVLFFAWTLYFVAQTSLAAARRTRAHMMLGLFGIALAAWMLFSGILAAIVSLAANLPGPRPDAARAAAALSFSGTLLFTTFIAVGITNIGRPDVHRRAMTLAAFSIIQAAIARLIMIVPQIAQPERIVIGAVIVDLLLIGVVLLDRRAIGRVHPMWVAGLALIVTVQWLRVVIARTEAWAVFTAWLAQLG
ncbi:MAG TPA: hypothetical protein VF339_12220 [Gammaproteobacteria bacterium]